MNGQERYFNRHAVKPLACLEGGWRLIKDNYWLFLGISLVGIIIGNVVPFGILLGPAMCGIYLCLLRRELGLPVTFDMLFKGFDYFVQSLIATLIMVAATMVLTIPIVVLFLIAMFTTLAAQPRGKPPDPFAGLTFLGLYGLLWLVVVVISWVVHVLFFFTYPLIIDRRLSGWEAVQLSFRASFGNFGGIIGLTLLNALFSFAGLCACYVGAVFVLPVTLAATAIAYRQVFPMESIDETRLDQWPTPWHEGSSGG